MGLHLQGGLRGFGATFLTMHQMSLGSVGLDVGWHTGSGLASPTHKKAIEVSSLRYVCQQSSCRYVCQRSSYQPDTYASDPPIAMCASDLPIASALCDLPIAIVWNSMFVDAARWLLSGLRTSPYLIVNLATGELAFAFVCCVKRVLCDCVVLVCRRV